MHEGIPRVSPARFEEAKKALIPEERITIGRLMEPAGEILRQLAPELKNGTYQLIIGDDVSGRIPAIILNEAIKKIYKAYGHDAPILRFVAGGRREKWTEGISNELARKQEMIERTGDMHEELIRDGRPARALIVTEAIHTGDNMQLLIEGMRRAGISADIASIGYIEEVDDKPGLPIDLIERKLKSRVVVGESGLPSIYNSENKYLQGVVKENGSATSKTFAGHKAPPEERIAVQRRINAARILSLNMGSELGDSFLEEELKETK